MVILELLAVVCIIILFVRVSDLKKSNQLLKYRIKKLEEKAQKAAPQSDQNEHQPQQFEPQTKRAPTAIEQLLEEFKQEALEQEEVYKPEPIQEAPTRESYSVPSERPNIEAILPDEKIDIVPHKPLQRKRPVYGRSEAFVIKEETNEIASEIHDLLAEVDGPKKALILSEIMNRKY